MCACVCRCFATALRACSTIIITVRAASPQLATVQAQRDAEKARADAAEDRVVACQNELTQLRASQGALQKKVADVTKTVESQQQRVSEAEAAATRAQDEVDELTAKRNAAVRKAKSLSKRMAKMLAVRRPRMTPLSHGCGCCVATGSSVASGCCVAHNRSRNQFLRWKRCCTRRTNCWWQRKSPSKKPSS